MAGRTGSLTKNEPYQFASQHLFAIYPLKAVYTFIPKNGCSSLRYSIARSNGFLDSLDDVNWIHKNLDAFIASKYEAATADYAFVVLRDPFRRLASGYLNKIVDVGHRTPFQFDAQSTKRTTSGLSRWPEKVFGKRKLTNTDLSFEEFVDKVAGQARHLRNHHWRNQTDFLLFEEYDDYFRLEEFDVARESLLNRGFEVVDTRGALKHDSQRLTPLEGAHSNIPASQIKRMKNDGVVPSIASLYSAATYEKVAATYEDDLSLYSSLFGKESLFTLTAN